MNAYGFSCMCLCMCVFESVHVILFYVCSRVYVCDGVCIYVSS